MFENYFKSKEDVVEYFGSEVFKFAFMSDNTMFFKSLNPIFIGDELFEFQISFYFEYGECFFAYSSFDSWLDAFQLSEVICTSVETQEKSVMFFKKYNNE